nr:protein VAC14 homolog [Rhipicephalus microplus]
MSFSAKSTSQEKAPNADSTATSAASVAQGGSSALSKPPVQDKLVLDERRSRQSHRRQSKSAARATVFHAEQCYENADKSGCTEKEACALTLKWSLRDIITESASFDLVAFMPLLRERVYTKHNFARAFVVSWVSVMNSVPDIDMLIFLPEILDGLSTYLKILAYFAISPIIAAEELCPFDCALLQKHPSMNTTLLKPFGIIPGGITARSHPDRVDFAAMIRNLIVHSHSSAIRETAKAVNMRLMHLVTEEDDQPLSRGPAGSDSDSPATRGLGLGVQQRIAGELQPEGVNAIAVPIATELELTPLVNVLTRQLMHVSMQTRIAVLRWFLHLFTKIPNKIFLHVEEIFPKLLQTLSDPSDEVVLLDLEVLAEISSSSAPGGSGAIKRAINSDGSVPAGDAAAAPNCYFGKFMLSLLDLFQSDLQLLEDRGSFIIRQLCVLLSAEDIYQSLSEILLGREDLRFAAHMVQTLNTILLTSTELFELRNQLKDLNTKESCSLFCCLYRSWCHNPVATISLCLLTQNYEHTCSLLHLFSDMEVTVEFLTEIDKLVQLIESPIFTYLRLQLLDSPQQSYLVKSLYGLLMLLPQSEAFHTLRTRLACLPHPSLQQMDTGATVRRFVENNSAERCKSEINFQELLEHFQKVQESHKKAKPAARLSQVLRLSGAIDSGPQA